MASPIFLACYLPELTWEGEPPFTSHAFLDEGPELIGAVRPGLDRLILQNDIVNLRRFWLKKSSAHKAGHAALEHDGADLASPHLLGPADLELLLLPRTAGNDDLPPETPGLLRDFATDREGPVTEKEFENLFFEYFRRLRSDRSAFLRRWAEFELKLRMFLAAVRCRKAGLDIEKALPPGDPFAEILAAGKAQSDFGCSGQFPECEAVLTSLNLGLPDRERALDRVRFEWLRWTDTETMFAPDAVLSFFLRLLLMERWEKIRETAGGQSVKDKILKE